MAIAFRQTWPFRRRTGNSPHRLRCCKDQCTQCHFAILRLTVSKKADVSDRGKHIPHKVFWWSKFLGEAQKSQKEPTSCWMKLKSKRKGLTPLSCGSDVSSVVTRLRHPEMTSSSSSMLGYSEGEHPTAAGAFFKTSHRDWRSFQTRLLACEEWKRLFKFYWYPIGKALAPQYHVPL